MSDIRASRADSNDGRVALVTGGATGIGRACIERFLRDGMAVVFTDISAADGEQTLSDLQGGGKRIACVAGDVRARAQDAVRKRNLVQVRHAGAPVCA